jgi:hypothetical protein
MKLSSATAVLGLLGVAAAVPATATTINLSTGTAPYTITADTNAEGLVPTTVNTPLPGGWIASLNDGIGDSGVWIAPAAAQNGEPGSVSGSTTYELMFSLTGLNPATAVLTINLTGDDYVNATLNGNPIFTATGTQVSSGMWTTESGTFTVTTGFLPTTNTLDFVVPNNSSDGAPCCGPTGLDVAASVTASPLTSGTPEPSTTLPLALVAVAGGVVLYRRKRFEA